MGGFWFRLLQDIKLGSSSFTPHLPFFYNSNPRSSLPLRPIYDGLEQPAVHPGGVSSYVYDIFSFEILDFFFSFFPANHTS